MAHALYGYNGPCKNIHGHTYHLHVTWRGKPLQDNHHPKNGMVMDFKDIKTVIKKKITDKFDHALVLNANSPHKKLDKKLTEQFEKVIFLPSQPTCENLLIHFQKILMAVKKPGIKLVCIKLEETPSSFAEWFLSDNV